MRYAAGNAFHPSRDEMCKDGIYQKNLPANPCGRENRLHRPFAFREEIYILTRVRRECVCIQKLHIHKHFMSFLADTRTMFPPCSEGTPANVCKVATILMFLSVRLVFQVSGQNYGYFSKYQTKQDFICVCGDIFSQFEAANAPTACPPRTAGGKPPVSRGDIPLCPLRTVA